VVCWKYLNLRLGLLSCFAPGKWSEGVQVN
jgi:hypothetical protein